MLPKPSLMLPARYGGIIMAVISSGPGLSLINCFCCAGILFGGMMSVFFYKKDLLPDHPQLTSGDAIALGALAGVFGALIGTAITAGILAAFGNVTAELIRNVLEKYSEDLPPGTLDQIESGMARGGFTILHLISSLVIDTIFGLLGGLIGYAIWKPKTLQMPPPSYMPPPPPPAAPQG